MEPEGLMRLESQFRSFADGDLRRITAAERDQFREEALRLAEGELARRGLPLLRPEEPGATTNRLVGFRLQIEGEPCRICGSVLAANSFCVLIPIVRYARYRALLDRRMYGDPPRTRRMKDGRSSVQAIAP